MRIGTKGLISAATLLCAVAVQAAPPDYERDPFDDFEPEEAPLILDVRYPTHGRGELGVLFASSLTDKYNSHMGAIIEASYMVTRTMGMALHVGFMHGSLTPIVTDAEGILGNRVDNCRNNQTTCTNLDPEVPDYRQVTGLVDALFVWAPLYGKINVVSELDVNMQLYLLAGLGVNGTRSVEAQVEGVPQDRTDYTLTGDAVGSGGFFSNPFFHGTGGIGLRVFLTEWLDIRGEVRGVFFRDSFDFGAGEESYWSDHYFGQLGVGFILF